MYHSASFSLKPSMSTYKTDQSFAAETSQRGTTWQPLSVSRTENLSVPAPESFTSPPPFFRLPSLTFAPSPQHRCLLAHTTSSPSSWSETTTMLLLHHRLSQRDHRPHSGHRRYLQPAPLPPTSSDNTTSTTPSHHYIFHQPHHHHHVLLIFLHLETRRPLTLSRSRSILSTASL